MSVTSPDSIFHPDGSEPFTPIQSMGAMAASMQTALNRRGFLYGGTVAQRLAFTTAPDGVRWQDTDGSRGEYMARSGVWRGVTPLTGTVSLSPPSGGGTVTQQVTFPTGYFQTTPTVIVSAGDGAGPTVTVNISAISITSSGFVVNLSRSNSTTTRINWVAYP